MASIPQPSTPLQPSFTPSPSPSPSKQPPPLTPTTFTGMVSTNPASTELRYRGTFNQLGRGTDLYDRRLAANLALNGNEGGYSEWNRRRQEAIDRGEDPNAELIARIEARRPDSLIERTWRRVRGEGED